MRQCWILFVAGSLAVSPPALFSLAFSSDFLGDSFRPSFFPFTEPSVEVDMRWEDGRLIRAVIHSKAGLPCGVVYGDKNWEFNTKAGKSYPLTLAKK